MKARHYVLLLGFACTFAHAQDYAPSTSDFGGVGLLQMPTARFFEDGELALTYNRTLPYNRAALTFVPVPWLEANIRYTDISNRDYDPTGTISRQSYKDKSIDFKFSLNDESYYVPQLAVGFRDIGGTALFAGEYIVASKRFDNVDLTLGVAWGNTGANGDLRNRFAWALGDRYNARPGRDKNDYGGTVKFDSFFRGPMQPFAGIEYQTPWQPLSIKVEYDGNNYQFEPLNNSLVQHSPINVGAVFAVSDFFSIHAGLERGNKAMLGFTLHNNFGKAKPLPKLSDPAPEPLQEKSTPSDWKQTSERISTTSGYQVRSISLKEKEIIINGTQTRYSSNPKGMGRIARVVNNAAPNDIEWITVIDEHLGLATKETTFSKDAFLHYARHDSDIEPLALSLSEKPANSKNASTVYHMDEPDRFSYGAGIGYKQSLGGPDRFILYQFTADGSAHYFFKPNLWWSGGLSIALLDNYDDFIYDGPSLLPRVRTDVRQYLTTATVMMPFFQLTHASQLSDNVFAMTYGGALETMYGGVGGEILYRPFGERYALGMDINWVRQRDFAQDFNFRDYETVTGHISHYWHTGFSDILLTTSVGRYLAKDWGATVDISRSFTNGVVMGGYITRTDVSAKEFGEGSFDKGIYISIPFDLLITSSTLHKATIHWSPLTRDGGAKLGKRYGLYPLTKDRNLDRFHQDLPQIIE